MELFRPVGLHELALIWDSGMRALPPRLPHQPIFYPLIGREYAAKIAADWNPRDEASGFCGFVTRFSVSESFISRFQPQSAGSSAHLEYWIPADELNSLNSDIEGLIGVEDGFFGSAFQGWVPNQFGLKGKDVVSQFINLLKTWDYSRMDFVCEVSANRKALFLNLAFWAGHDFGTAGVDAGQRDLIVRCLREAWEFNRIEIPLPNARTV